MSEPKAPEHIKQALKRMSPHLGVRFNHRTGKMQITERGQFVKQIQTKGGKFRQPGEDTLAQLQRDHRVSDPQAYIKGIESEEKDAEERKAKHFRNMRTDRIKEIAPRITGGRRVFSVPKNIGRAGKKSS